MKLDNISLCLNNAQKQKRSAEFVISLLEVDLLQIVISKRKTKSTIGDLVTTDNYRNTVIASGNEQKAEVLGSYFSGVFTKENNIPYDTT